MKNLIKLLLILFIFNYCNNDATNPTDNINYREEMRTFVQEISSYAKTFKSDFLIIPQNGHDIITEDGLANGAPVFEYLAAIDGMGREDLFYGYDADNTATPDYVTDEISAFLDIGKYYNLTILVTDYCWDPSYINNSYQQNFNKGYISFAAEHRELDNIPLNPASPYNLNSSDILYLSQAKNFLYIINAELYDSKEDFINTLGNSNYDMFIIDPYFNEKLPLSSSDINSLKTKPIGGARMVIAYLSIGEAEDYRFYWKTEWTNNPPAWIEQENPDWPGNYKVRYWNKDWQSIIYGNDSSYVKKMLDAGFDGAYLDIIDAFEYFENR